MIPAFLIKCAVQPKAKESGGPLNLKPTFRRLLQNRHYRWGVVAQFFYVGAQIGVWSFTIRYVMKKLQLEELLIAGLLPAGKTVEQVVASYYTAALILFAFPRFLCTWIMRYVTPENLLTTLAILGGAVITQIQGFVSDLAHSINLAYLVPLVCFAVIAYYGAVACRKDVPETIRSGGIPG